jgi:hypothetical protein
LIVAAAWAAVITSTVAVIVMTMIDAIVGEARL